MMHILSSVHEHLIHFFLHFFFFLHHTYYVEAVERNPIQMSTLYMQNHKLHLLLVYMQLASFHTHAVSIHITESKY